MSNTIVHLEVGSNPFAPTGEDLQELVTLFNKESFVTLNKNNVKVHKYELNPFAELKFIIRVGARDWDPTDVELALVEKMFMEAVASEDTIYVVATRAGVEFSWFEVPMKPSEAPAFEPE